MTDYNIFDFIPKMKKKKKEKKKERERQSKDFYMNARKTLIACNN